MVSIRLWFCVLCFHSLSPLFSMLESKSSSSTERRPENYLKFLNYRSFLRSCKRRHQLESWVVSKIQWFIWNFSVSLSVFTGVEYGEGYSASTDNIIVPFCRVPPPFKLIYADVVLPRTHLSHIIWKLKWSLVDWRAKSLRGLVTTLFAN